MKARAGPASVAATVKPTTRLDKWLWQARFFKTRGAATDAVAEGRVRVNGQRVTKPGHAVGPGDTLTLVWDDRIRLIRVLESGLRRGPATEARTLYLDLDESRAALQNPAAPSSLE